MRPLLLVLLVACRSAPADTKTQITREAPVATAAGDAACPLPCGPAPKTICCKAQDKCCAEGVAAHFYCYSGPGDCPMRP